ncbi:ABC transporter ATP-binding protein [Mycobacterium sp. NPDC003323]
MSLQANDIGWTRSGRLVLDGVTIGPAPGATVGLLGPNGSGKSSLLKLLAGVHRPSEGTVHLDGEPVARISKRALARRVALVAQHSETELHITVRDVVRLGRIPYTGMTGTDDAGTVIVETALSATGLLDMTDRYWHTLSGGERQRVQIARALAQDPDYLLLDEPTNHLDIAHQLEILRLIRRLGVTSVVALHDLNLAAMFCDHIVVLSAGTVVAAGAPAQVLTEELVRSVYGVACTVTVEDGYPHVRFAYR